MFTRICVAMGMSGLAACGSSQQAGLAAGLEQTRACPKLSTLSAETFVCEPILPAQPCPPSHRPVLGTTACERVGEPQCAAGFAPASDGWGCVAVIPPVACTGATKEVIGMEACQPIGDCNAPFPPADATLFVDDDFATTDATHFRSIAAAMAAAKVGDTIAVEAGKYQGNLKPQRPMTVVGRCAEKVIIEGPSTLPGFQVTYPLALRGVTVKKFTWGAVLLPGADLTLSEAVFEENRVTGIALQQGTHATVNNVVVRQTQPDADGLWGIGFTLRPEARLQLNDSALVGNHESGIALSGAGSAVLNRAIVRDTQPDATGAGDGIRAESGGTVELTGSLLVNNREVGVTGINAKITIVDSVISRDSSLSNEAEGVLAQNSELRLERSSIIGTRAAGVAVVDKSKATILSSTIRDTRPANAISAGVFVDNSARLEMNDTALFSNQGLGLTVTRKSQATVTASLVQATHDSNIAPTYEKGIEVSRGSEFTLRNSALLDNLQAGLVVIEDSLLLEKSKAVVEGTLIAQTRRRGDGTKGQGVGVVAALATFTDCALVNNAEAGASVRGPAELRFNRSLVVGTQRAAGYYGFGVATDDHSTLVMLDSEVSGSAGVGVAIAGSSALLKGGGIARNAIGVQSANDVELRTGVVIDEAVTPNVFWVSDTTVFVDNGVRVGGGVLLLPDPPSITSIFSGRASP